MTSQQFRNALVLELQRFGFSETWSGGKGSLLQGRSPAGKHWSLGVRKAHGQIVLSKTLPQRDDHPEHDWKAGSLGVVCEWRVADDDFFAAIAETIRWLGTFYPELVTAQKYLLETEERVVTVRFTGRIEVKLRAPKGGEPSVASLDSDVLRRAICFGSLVVEEAQIIGGNNET